jgi:hypothetical protein
MNKRNEYMTNEARNAATGLMRTLLRLGVITQEIFDHTNSLLAERNESHLVGTHPAIMPLFRVNKRR